MFSLIKNDRYQPYIFVVSFIIVFIGIIYFLNPTLPPAQNITSLANIFITVVAIFVWFLGVGLTLVYQGQQNENIQMLRANNKYGLLISYFKHAIIWSMLAVCVWIFVSLWFVINWWILLILISINVLVLSLNYRIIHFLFKVLEN